ncbi:hypothetical protein Cni_G01223 [Canna indica]|uniref:Uncharacterized protein n=1 Tax=Canna indica TaxID=4628 RepID=A0AAQ3JMW2_9LILI|nr:hypothetical protein Cni_G01223 [Canna indica]
MAISLRVGLSMPRPSPAREAAIRGPDVVGVPQKQFQQGASTMKEIKLVCSITRRDAMSYLFAAFFTISTGNDTVEVRSMKPETRRKIREKLNKLREKDGYQKKKSTQSLTWKTHQ